MSSKSTITAMSTVQELMYFLSFTCQGPDDLDLVKTILINRENGFKTELEILRKDVDNLQEEYDMEGYELKQKVLELNENHQDKINVLQSEKLEIEEKLGIYKREVEDLEEKMLKYKNELIESRKEAYELQQKILELNGNHEEKIKALQTEKLELKKKSGVYKRELEDLMEKMLKMNKSIEDLKEMILKNETGLIKSKKEAYELKHEFLELNRNHREKIEVLQTEKSEMEDKILKTNKSTKDLEEKMLNYLTELINSRKESYELKQKILELNENHEEKIKVLQAKIKEKSTVYKRELEDLMKLTLKANNNIEKVSNIDVRGILGKITAGLEVENESNGSYDSGMEGSHKEVVYEHPRLENTCHKRKRSESEGEIDNKVSVSVHGQIAHRNVKESIDGDKGKLPNLAHNSLLNSTIIKPCERTKGNPGSTSSKTDLDKFLADPQLCMNAICALYRDRFSPQRNFTFFCSDKTWRIAKYLINKDPENRLSRTISEVRDYDPQMLQTCEELVKMYRKVLTKLYRSKLDPFFSVSE